MRLLRPTTLVLARIVVLLLHCGIPCARSVLWGLRWGEGKVLRLQPHALCRWRERVLCMKDTSCLRSRLTLLCIWTCGTVPKPHSLFSKASLPLDQSEHMMPAACNCILTSASRA